MTATRKDYADAMGVQSACNLRGILRSMTEIADRLPPDHPVLRLFAEQVMYLTGGAYGESTSYTAAYAACEEALNASQEGT